MELARDRAALAAEEVLADERLPRLQLVAGELPDAVGQRPHPGEVERGLDAVERAQGERDLGDVGVARPLPHPVDRPVNPPGSGSNGGDRVRRCQAEVVVPVEVNRDVGPDELAGALDQLADGLRPRHADRVDDHDLRGAGLRGGRVRRVVEVRLRARGVDAEVADPDPALHGVGDRRADPLEHGLARDAERLQLQIGDRRLDHARLRRRAPRAPPRRRAPRARSPRSRPPGRRPRSAGPRGSRPRRPAGTPPRSARRRPPRGRARSRACRRASGRRRPSARRRGASCRRSRPQRRSRAGG